MKVSKYNHYCDLTEDGKGLLFNCHTCGMGLIDSETSKKISNLFESINNCKDISKYEEDTELIGKLKAGYFIIEDSFNELERLKLAYRISQFSTNILSLTIAPTLNCNFYCNYCYESNTSQKYSPVMDKEIIEAIKQFIESYVKTYKIENIFIGWYGGEPMLEYELIVDACKEFNELGQSLGCKINYSMVSNGYLLDKGKAQELQELGITGVQITVDGTKEVHNSRRMLKSGSGTFDQIIKNIKEITPYIGVGLRVNVDTHNFNNIDDFLNYLIGEGLKEKVSLSFSATTSDTEGCSSIKSQCFTDEDFALKAIELYKKAAELGFAVDNYPTPITTWCAAVKAGNYLIEPDGTVQKCWAYIGSSKDSIGNILNSSDILYNSTKWLLWEPYENTECKECNILPICMGGCPYKAFELNDGIPVCSIWKYNLNENMKLNYILESSSN